MSFVTFEPERHRSAKFSLHCISNLIPTVIVRTVRCFLPSAVIKILMIHDRDFLPLPAC